MNARSEKNLKTCHPDLQGVLRIVDEQIPIVVTEGHRSRIRQVYLYLTGKSKLKEGKHNSNPSDAADVYPAPINWTDTNRMYYLAGVVMTVAKQKKVNLRWGGNWSMDNNFADNKFNDLGHFERYNES